MKWTVFSSLRWVPGLALLCVLAGCSQNDPPQFRLDMVAIAENQIPPDQTQEIANILEAMFGTPDVPFVLPETGLDLAKLQMAAGPVKSDQFGHETGLYRRHCAHCHGTTGDGMGPTALISGPLSARLSPGQVQVQEHRAGGQAHHL